MPVHLVNRSQYRRMSMARFLIGFSGCLKLRARLVLLSMARSVSTSMNNVLCLGCLTVDSKDAASEVSPYPSASFSPTHSLSYVLSLRVWSPSGLWRPIYHDWSDGGMIIARSTTVHPTPLFSTTPRMSHS